MSCIGCFTKGKSKQQALTDLQNKAQHYATAMQEPMVIYQTTEEYKFMTYAQAVTDNLNIDWIIYP